MSEFEIESSRVGREIDRIFGDTTVPLEETLSRMQAIVDRCEMNIDALRGDIKRRDAG